METSDSIFFRIQNGMNAWEKKVSETSKVHQGSTVHGSTPRKPEKDQKLTE